MPANDKPSDLTPGPLGPLAPASRVVTRFAPSPTGMLHVGGARTALFNWAFARHHGGLFLLRIEDTDQVRSTQAATDQIIADLQWLGLDWDRGPGEPALAGGPYFQSQRGEIYRAYLERLRETGRVYEKDGALYFAMPDHAITVHDLILGDVTIEAGQTQMQDFVIFKSAPFSGRREASLASGGASGTESERAAGPENEQSRTPNPKPQTPNPILGGPTFHFANVVDDADMGVTHVIRGQEHLNNTVKHLALFEALGIDPPRYAHIPLIFNPDGSKMSKRDKAKAARVAAGGARFSVRERNAWIKHLCELNEEVRHLTDPPGSTIDETESQGFLDKQNDSVAVAELIAFDLNVPLPEIDVSDFQASGYLPSALMNYLALLGWNPGGDVEQFGPDPLDFMREHFSLDRVQKGQAKFDRDKLLDFNRQAIAAMHPEDFKRAIWHAPRAGNVLLNVFTDEDDPRLDWLAQATQERSRTLCDPVEQNRYLFLGTDIEFDEKAVKKNLTRNEGEGLKLLEAVHSDLAAIPDDQWNPHHIQSVIEAFTQKHNLKNMGKIAQPLRVAVSGAAVTPPIDLTLVILGKAQTLRRISECQSRIKREEILKDPHAGNHNS